MTSVRVNFTLPENLYSALKMFIPERQRSQVISKLVEKEIEKRAHHLSKIALDVENDKTVAKDMKDWGNTNSDGLEDHPWK